MQLLMYLAAVSVIPPTTATWDFLFNWYLVSGVVSAAFVIGLLLFFAVRYRAKGDRPASYRREKERLWIPVATVVIMSLVLLAAGVQTFASASNIAIPESTNSVTIKVLAYQWGWNFTYPDGSFAIDNLTVPAGETVILNITSRDVFHSFGIGMLAVKEDAIPGKINQLWFNVPTPGVYVDAIRCYELCGVGHSFMIANLTVVSQQSWTAWMNSGVA